VPKPIKLLEGIGNGGNDVLWYRAQQFCEQMVNISYFYNLLKFMGNSRQLSTCRFIFRAHAAHTALLPSANFGLSDWS